MPTAARTWVLILTSVASFMVALDTLVVSTALSTIQRDLDATIEELEWTVNAYNLSFAVLLMTAAALGDRFGRRRLFVAGLALFVAASAACALAPDLGSLIAARAVQGIGAALVAPLGLALLGAAFPPGLAGAGFTGPKSTLREAGVVLQPEGAADGLGGGGAFSAVPFEAGELSLGDVSHEHVPAVDGAFPKQLERSMGFRIGGLISHQFFRSHALTLDFSAMRLRIA